MRALALIAILAARVSAAGSAEDTEVVKDTFEDLVTAVVDADAESLIDVTISEYWTQFTETQGLGTRTAVGSLSRSSFTLNTVMSNFRFYVVSYACTLSPDSPGCSLLHQHSDEGFVVDYQEHLVKLCGDQDVFGMGASFTAKTKCFSLSLVKTGSHSNRLKPASWSPLMDAIVNGDDGPPNTKIECRELAYHVSYVCVVEHDDNWNTGTAAGTFFSEANFFEATSGYSALTSIQGNTHCFSITVIDRLTMLVAAAAELAAQVFEFQSVTTMAQIFGVDHASRFITSNVGQKLRTVAAVNLVYAGFYDSAYIFGCATGMVAFYHPVYAVDAQIAGILNIYPDALRLLEAALTVNVVFADSPIDRASQNFAEHFFVGTDECPQSGFRLSQNVLTGPSPSAALNWWPHICNMDMEKSYAYTYLVPLPTNLIYALAAGIPVSASLPSSEGFCYTPGGCLAV